MSPSPITRLAPRLLCFLASICLLNAAYPTTYSFRAWLSGDKEAVANDSPGTGYAELVFNTTAQTMWISVWFSGLEAATTAAHIHSATVLPRAGTAGVATQTPLFEGFPTGVTSGAYEHTFDLTQTTSFNSSFITANGGTVASASDALLAGLLAEKAYLNIHTTKYPPGEIRGFWNVPEEGATGLAAAIALVAMILGARRRPVRL